MSTPARSLQSSTPASRPNFVTDEEKPSFLEQFYSLVSNRAYLLFEQSGYTEGDDVAHWLQAERELASVPAIQESKDAFTVTIPVRGIPADQIKVCASDEKVIVSAKSETEDSSQEHRSLYYMATWPERVAADGYKSELRNGILTVTARKALPTESRAGADAAPKTGAPASTSKEPVK